MLRPHGHLLVFDSQLPAERERVEVRQRPLNDGSVHAVLKVYYTPATLTDALASVFGTRATGARSNSRFFVFGAHEPGA